MNGWQIGVLIGLVLAVALVAVLLITRGGTPAAKKKKVKNTLKQYAGIRGYRVLSDVTLPCGKRTVHVDDILIGFFGLLFINVQTEEADFYGDERDESWAMVKDETKTTFPNPLGEMTLAMDAARAIFAKNEVYSISMEPLVVFSSKFKKNTLYVKEFLPVVSEHKLRALLSKTRFEKDTGVDIAALAALLGENKK